MTILEASGLLRKGEVVAFPTETVYGLGADAGNPDAVKKIFEIKGRPDDNPLIVHLSEISQVEDFASEIPDPAKKMMKCCWPGPLTLVLPKKPVVLDSVTSGLPTVALRMPDHKMALELIRLTGPLVAPSANRSGKPSPTKAEHVLLDLGENFPVLDGGEAMIGLESTVLDVSNSPYSVLRPGKFTPGQLSEISGVDVIIDLPGQEQPKSPGVKYTHYKPEAVVRWLDKASGLTGENTLLITHQSVVGGFPNHVHFNKNYELMARQLYDLFRTADYKQLSSITIEPLPDNKIHPLIAALRNRIEKAMG